MPVRFEWTERRVSTAGPRSDEVRLALASDMRRVFAFGRHDTALTSRVIHGMDMEASDLCSVSLIIEAHYFDSLAVEYPHLWAVFEEPVQFEIAAESRPQLSIELHRLMIEVQGGAQPDPLGLKLALLRILHGVSREHRENVGTEADRAQVRIVVDLRQLLIQAQKYAPSPADCAASLNLGLAVLRDACRSVVGVMPADIVRSARLLLAKRLLQFTSSGIGQIALELGFASTSIFSSVFTAQTGMNPTRFRRIVLFSDRYAF